MFGAHLERVWGAKRFFIFYISCGLGAFLLYNSIGVWQIMELKQELIAKGYDIAHFNMLVEDIGNRQISGSNPPEVIEYVQYNYSTLVGASGAIFGLLAGFAMLFPNTELYLMFIPVPIKAKYLIGVYLAFEVYSSVTNPNDQIAHLAHVGGAIVGIIFILIWRRTDRKNFY
jgi:rhomboid-like protein